MLTLLATLKSKVMAATLAARPRPREARGGNGVLDPAAHKRQVEQLLRGRQAQWRLRC